MSVPCRVNSSIQDLKRDLVMRDEHYCMTRARRIIETQYYYEQISICRLTYVVIPRSLLLRLRRQAL